MTVDACPHCDTASELYLRSGVDDPTIGERYRCYECGETFDEPVQRSPKTPGGDSRHGLAKQLVDADPDTPHPGGDA